eukprot:jgi/Mesen1/10015/ME000722S09297
MDLAANGSSEAKHSHGWQQVKNPKKQKYQDSKDAKKSGGSDVSKAGGKGLKAPDSSIFAALDEASTERRARLAASQVANEEALNSSDDDEERDPSASNGIASSLPQEEAKPKVKKVKKPKVTVADSASAIDVADLTAFLAQISESFSSAPDVQLMRCADYFARAFANVTTAQFNWLKLLKESELAKAVEVPLCYLPEDVVTAASDWLATKPVEQLGAFVLLLLQAALEDLPPPPGAKSQKASAASLAPPKAKVGTLVVLAMVLRKKPEVLVLQAEAMRTSPQFQGQDRLLALSWVYGQVAQADLATGMWFWVRNLLPLAAGKASTPFTRDTVLLFFEGVICKNLKKARQVLLNGAARKGERLVPPVALNSLLYLTFPLESGRTKATERFRAIYPIVKQVAQGGVGSKTAKPAALQLMPLSLAAAGEEPAELAEEAVCNLVWCLSQNPDCYKQWDKHHLDSVKASSRVVGTLVRDWTQHQGQLEAPLLKKTLLSMRRKEALEAAGGDVERERALRKLDALCRALLGKVSGPGCLRITTYAAVVGAMVYGFYCLSPDNNPWGWDGKLLLSKTHPVFKSW